MEEIYVIDTNYLVIKTVDNETITVAKISASYMCFINKHNMEMFSIQHNKARIITEKFRFCLY